MIHSITLLTLLIAALHAADTLLIEYGQPRTEIVIAEKPARMTAKDLRKQMLLFKDTQVAVMEWCITSGSRVNFPAQTSELIGTGVKEFGRRGDQLAVDTLRRLAAGQGHRLHQCSSAKKASPTDHDTTAAEDKLIAAGKMVEPPHGVLSTEQLRARAARWYAAGAVGVHLFNVGNIVAMKTLGSVKAAKTDGAKMNPLNTPLPTKHTLTHHTHTP